MVEGIASNQLAIPLWERTLCATIRRSGTPHRRCRAQGALLQSFSSWMDSPAQFRQQGSEAYHKA